MKKFLIVFVFFINFLYSEESYCLFTPPDHWSCAMPNQTTEYVKIGFLGKSKKPFKPSINLAIEKTDSSFDEYVEAVKDIYQNDKNSSVKDLGFIKTKSGKAFLIEIRSKTSYEDIVMLQLLNVQDGYAYVMTGASSKEDFIRVHQDLLFTFNSLTVAKDLFDLIADEKIKKEVIDKYNLSLSNCQTLSEKKQKQEITKLQKFLEKKLHKINPYFQIQLFQKLSNDLKEKAKDKL